MNHLSSKRGLKWTDLGWQTPNEGRGAPRFGGELLCLIDENCFSTTDNLASCLRDLHPNVRFIGKPTGGGSGAPRTFTLPSTGARVTFCTMRAYAPNGDPIEGNSVQPDVLIRPTRAQQLEDADAALEFALAELR